jgi:hypothetical protein
MESWAGEGKNEEESWASGRVELVSAQGNLENRQTFSTFESFPNLQTKMN